MTEAEWLACTDPQKMLKFLQGNASDRKLRLFAVACVRRFWSHLTDERSRRAVGVAEREADGCGGEKALRLAEQDAKAAIPSLFLGFRPSEQAAAAGARALVNVAAVEAARLACGWARNISFALAIEEEPGNWSSVKKNEVFEDWDADAVALLRCIYGNPFRPVALDLGWLTPEVVVLAGVVYNELAFDRLPILADALEDAGCTDQDTLGHLRGPGPHVRGCWVIDLLLGKE
jgi:hypothetical protein